jgi:hypothetical protein
MKNEKWKKYFLLEILFEIFTLLVTVPSSSIEAEYMAVYEMVTDLT